MLTVFEVVQIIKCITDPTSHNFLENVVLTGQHVMITDYKRQYVRLKSYVPVLSLVSIKKHIAMTCVVTENIESTARNY